MSVITKVLHAGSKRLLVLDSDFDGYGKPSFTLSGHKFKIIYPMSSRIIKDSIGISADETAYPDTFFIGKQIA
jgi:hypothetical protein